MNDKPFEMLDLSRMLVIINSDIVEAIVSDYEVTGFSMTYGDYGGRAVVDIDADVAPSFNGDTHVVPNELVHFEFDNELLDVCCEPLANEDYVVIKKDDIKNYINQYNEMDKALSETNAKIEKLNWLQRLMWF